MRVRQELAESTVTIMFTDLVASTALGDGLGDDRGQALRRAHDRILRQQFERFGGRVVKGRGDGFMAVFPSARGGYSAQSGCSGRSPRSRRRGPPTAYGPGGGTSPA
jgi:class 3 adenylate cyclase